MLNHLIESDRFLNEFLTGFEAPSWPLTNVCEDADHVYVEAELPGLKLDDIEVTVHGKDLVLAGERKLPERENVQYHLRDVRGGKFEKRLRLPVAVDAEKVAAILQHGILTITLPKAQSARPRRIEVRPAG